MDERIVILGAGTGGALLANRLRLACPNDVQITVVDQDDRHLYQPGLLFVLFGSGDPEHLVHSRRAAVDLFGLSRRTLSSRSRTSSLWVSSTS